MNEFNKDRQETIRAKDIDTSSPEGFLRTLAEVSQLPRLEADTIARLREQMSQEQIVEYYTLLGNFYDERTGKLEIDPAQIMRPKALFHASQNNEIEEFEPREEKKRSADEPAQVFGTPSEAVSSMFLVPADDRFTKSGSYDNGKTWTFIIGDWENFKALDKGGWIYTLPEETFGVDPNTGLELFEWTSQVAVKPKTKKYFSSGLAAMQEYGVKVYVVDKDTFARFRSNEDDKKILETLKPLSLDAKDK
jgi:hypothetical protein